MSRAGIGLIGALVVAVGCGPMDVTPTSAADRAPVVPSSAVPDTTAAPTIVPTPPSTASPEPTRTRLTALPGVDADEFKQHLIDLLAPDCRDGDGTDQRLWTCTHGDEVEISTYGPSPTRVTAYRVVTRAPRIADRRSWLRMYASIISVEVFQWVADHFETNDGAQIGDVWLQMSHDDTSDGVLISIDRTVP